MPTHIMLLYSTFTQIYTHWPDRNAVLASRQCLLHIIKVYFSIVRHEIPEGFKKKHVGLDEQNLVGFFSI